jgi:hypothetical protein
VDSDRVGNERKDPLDPSPFRMLGKAHQALLSVNYAHLAILRK